jgi:uncharacterized membrane protein
VGVDIVRYRVCDASADPRIVNLHFSQELCMDPMTPDVGSDDERTTLLIAYVLHALAPFTGGLVGLIAVIISHIKVRQTQSAFIRSHHSWLIRTFWWAVVFLVIAYALMVVLIGWVVYAVVAIWWLYRTVRGFINYGEKREMPA